MVLGNGMETGEYKFIGEETVIKENIEQLIRQMSLIEKGDPLQLGLQASLRDEFIRKENQESIKKVN